MDVKNFQHGRHSLVSIIEPNIVGSGEKFENDGSCKVLANAVVHRRAILLIL